MKKIISAIILFIVFNEIFCQNVAITDDNAYVPNNSSVLDVKSTSKGMLIPRLTSIQRTSIATPALGLIVFDTNDSCFYYYNGLSWINLSAGNANNIWGINNYKVVVKDTSYNIGIGTKNPNYKLVVQGDGKASSGDTLFVVNNKNGQPVFIVTKDGAQVIVDETPKKNLGGFAVSGRTTGKGLNDYLLVNPDSVRIYVKDDGAKKNLGGFAVSGRTTGKGIAKDFLYMTPKNYFIGHETGKNNTTGIYNSFFGYQSGISNNAGSYNSFIGYKSGFSNTDGEFNLFLGSESGYNNVGGFDNNQGNYNIYVGYQSGYNNIKGRFNTFLGYQTGFLDSIGGFNVFIGYLSGYSNLCRDPFYSNSGQFNTFVGYETGRYSTFGAGSTYIGSRAGWGWNDSMKNIGNYNVYLGYETGFKNFDASNNIFIGREAAYEHKTGDNNVFIGYLSGHNNVSGYNNVFIGNYAGRTETGSNKFILECNDSTSKQSLMYGEFDTRVLRMNADVGIGKDATEKLDVKGAIRFGTTSSSNVGTIRWTGTDLEFRDLSSWKSLLTHFSLSSPTGSFTDALIVSNNGYIGINQSNPLYKLHSTSTTINNDSAAIYGEHDVSDNWGIGVEGKGRYRGVKGVGVTSIGEAIGIYGIASGGTSGNRYGVYGTASGGATAYAGYFDGNVNIVGNLNVTGTVSKAGGSFKIDHPLDPENKYLYHSFVESPDMKNIYDGIIVLDNDGKATVMLPDWFCALNKDFRYQLTSIGAPSGDLYISKEIADNKFEIAGGKPNLKVSWQVTGIRKDPWAEKNRIQVEVNKNQDEKGKYLYPDLYKMPPEKNVNYRKVK